MYSHIRLSGKLLAVSIALALMVSIAAFVFVLPFDTRAAAEPPEWEEGDGVAAGVELDVLQLYNQYSDGIEENLTDAVTDIAGDNASLDDFSVTKGSIKAFVMVGVTDATDEEVTVTQRMGFEINFKVTAQATVNDLPKAGTYNISEENATSYNVFISNEDNFNETDLEDMNSIMSFEIRIGFTQAFSVTFDKDSMNVNELAFSLRPSIMVDLQISKLLGVENPDENTTEISYGSINVFAKADVRSTLTLGFLPPLKLVDLPMEVGDTWNTSTENVSVDLGFEGIIDLQLTGTHPLIEEGNDAIDEMFGNISENMTNATGLDEFPIIIEEVSIPAEYFEEDEPAPTVEEDDGPFAGIDFEIVNGVFPTEMIPMPGIINLTCTGSNETDLLAIHNLTSDNSTVYWVWGDGATVPGVIDIPLDNITGGMHANVTDYYVGGIPYIADLGNFTMWDAAMEDGIEGMESEIVTMVEDLTGGEVNMSESFSFQPMTMSSVNDELDSIESAQDDIAASTATGDEDGGIMDIFLEPPYIGSIAVVLVVVILGLMVARKG